MNINLKEIMEEYEKLPFRPEGVYFAKLPPGHIQKGYTTSASAFVFPVRGQAAFHLNSNTYEFRPGNVIHGCPDKWLRANNGDQNPAEFFVMHYQYAGKDSAYMNSSYLLETGINARIFSMLRQLTNLYEKSDTYSKLQAKAIFYTILAEMFFDAKSIRQTAAHGIIENAKVYIEQYYMEPHTLEELSERYGMDQKYFSYVFKLHTGITPIDYLICYRLEQARRLLASTVCSIGEIAKAVGYKDGLYFSRQFKRRFGTSPSNFRERAKQNV